MNTVTTGFEGRTVLVTGGTSGIGLATAQRFAAAGAFVVVTGRRREAVDRAVETLGGSGLGVQADAASPADLDRVFAAVRARGRGLDVVVANAGGGSFASLAETTQEHVDETFGTNVDGVLFTVQKALPLLSAGASVIVTGSTAAPGGMPAFGAYAATKAALHSFVRTWAVELAPRGIRVNAVVPGPTATPGLSELAPDAAAAQALREQLAATVPLGRLIEPAEIAGTILFLASEAAGMITGSELLVDGGQTAAA
ncbi:SDR family NAD(P)-dependent oxidoreductase [Nakamurella deserti]|uniref:SDR family NAD(P)-dependent oxidoreductase n=1 Tax=Nakamurella deserti TaxID=2164074 RepID=UPI000DBE0DDE|nr:SDR family oxidoreductase [Nakamurella deserti]